MMVGDLWESHKDILTYHTVYRVILVGLTDTVGVEGVWDNDKPLPSVCNDGDPRDPMETPWQPIITYILSGTCTYRAWSQEDCNPTTFSIPISKVYDPYLHPPTCIYVYVYMYFIPQSWLSSTFKPCIYSSSLWLPSAVDHPMFNRENLVASTVKLGLIRLGRVWVNGRPTVVDGGLVSDICGSWAR